MCRTEPDVATLAMHLSLAPALLEAVHDATSTVYLRVSAATAGREAICESAAEACVNFARGSTTANISTVQYASLV